MEANTHTHAQETHLHGSYTKQRQFCPDENSPRGNKKQGILAPHFTQTLVTTPPPPFPRVLHTNMRTRTGRNKETDCSMLFPREGIPDFNGINLGALAGIIKKPPPPPTRRACHSGSVVVFICGETKRKERKWGKGSKHLLWLRVFKPEVIRSHVDRKSVV